MKKMTPQQTVFALMALASTQVGAQYTYNGSGNWSMAANWSHATNDGEVPGTDLDEQAVIPGGSVVTLNSTQPNVRALRLQGGSGTATLNIEPGADLQFTTHSSWDSSIGRAGADGVVSQSGGDISINFLELGRDNGTTGEYFLSGGSLNISRGGHSATGGSSLIIGTADSNASGGTATGLLEISGGQFTTRSGVWIGGTSGTADATFSVLGSGASEIGIGTTNTGTDGHWTLNAGATLAVGVELSGLTKILVDDHGNGNSFATFEAGSLLDVDYYGDGQGGGTWTVLELENGDIVDNGLAFAPGVDTSIWSFQVDNSGANGILTVTAAGDPPGILGNWFTIEAEDHSGQSGTRLEDCADTGGGQNVAYISGGDWCRYDDVTLGDNALLNFRVARPDDTDDGRIEVRLGSPTGTLIGQIDVPVTGGWQSWETVSVPVAPVVGKQDIYLVFVESSTTNGGSLFNLNWWSKTAMVEAEDFDAGAGYRFETTGDVGGGQNLGWISDGEWMEYTIEVEEPGFHRLNFRVAAPGSDGSIDIVSNGQTLGSVSIGDTGGYQSWTTVSTFVELPNAGVQTLRLEFVVPSSGFNLNWFAYQEAPQPLQIVVGNTPKQQMRYGLDYERLWFWQGSNAVRDRFAQWSVDDCDVDYIRVAINAKYELTEGVFQEDAYFDADDSEGGGTNNDRIIPMMRDMQEANPDIKFFASPRPLNEAVSGVAWQPYPQWITGSSGSNSNFNFDEVKCSEYLLRYLILMKHHGFQISYMDLTNEWNHLNAQDVRDISALFDDYLDGTKPVIHPDYPDVTLTAEDIPLLIAPSAWSYSQGSSWMNGVRFSSYRQALDIAACHNTDKGGTAQDFADSVRERYVDDEGELLSVPVPEIWNTEVHGWKSTSNADEVLTFAYMMECINAGFSGLSGWLAVGFSNQGHCYIVNSQRSVKYYIFKKLANTSHRGFALDVNEPDEFKVYWDPDPDQQDADSAVTALIRGNLMTVWTLNHSNTDHLVNIIPSGRTISDEPIRFTRWSQYDGLGVEGETGMIANPGDDSFYATVQDNSAYCFEILLEPESVPYVRTEAEGFQTSDPGVSSTGGDTGIGGGAHLEGLTDGSWTSYPNVDLSHSASIRLRVAAAAGSPDGWIEVRTGSPTGPRIGRVAIPETGGWQNWWTVETPIEPTPGTHDLYLVYVEAKSNEQGTGPMFNLDWFELIQTEAPAALAGGPESGSAVSLSWDEVPGAIGYVIKRSSGAGGPYSVVDDTLTDTSYIDQGLTAGSAYHYVIAARYENGATSANSAELVVIPSDPITIGDLDFGLPAMSPSGDQVSIELANSELGHLYQGQQKKNLSEGEWSDVGDAVAGNGGSLMFEFPVDPGDDKCFYRFVIERQ
ncbi:MAG: carbohydrate-binding protein [Verrucomicrobiota bacterium JB023]|nr:carbohydrate-binding protein [Verrucomicrobiota bacterium JB023]